MVILFAIFIVAAVDAFVLNHAINIFLIFTIHLSKISFSISLILTSIKNFESSFLNFFSHFPLSKLFSLHVALTNFHAVKYSTGLLAALNLCLASSVVRKVEEWSMREGRG